MEQNRINQPKSEFTLCDDINRPLLIIKDGRVFIPRYPDIDEDTKQIILEFLKENSNMDIDYISKFMDYKEEQDEFCS